MVAVLVLSVFSWKSLARPGYFPMHDDMQAMRVLQISKCVQDTQIPCRWVPDMGYGYGYPQFNYYSPLPYYVMEGFHLAGLGFLDSVKAGFILSFLLSGLTMFLLGRVIWGNWGGLVAAVFYLYAPYRAMDVYNRGAVGEFWALIFFPAVFWAVWQLVKTGQKRFIFWLALSLGGLFLSHNISSMIFLPFVFLWFLLLTWWEKKWSLTPKFVLGILWGFGLAAFFLLPAILEKQFAHTETMLMGYFNYLAHFSSLRQLFFSTHWGYSSSILGPYDDVSFTIGIFHWTIALVTFIIAFWRRKKFLFLLSLFFLAAGFLTTFMTHQRSVFFWDNLSFLAYLQFPWRFLVLSIFFFSILAAGIVSFVKSEKKKWALAVFLIFVVMFFNLSFFRPSRWFPLTDQEKFTGQLWEKQLTISIFDYLPIFAKMPPDQKAPDEPIILSGEAKVKDFQKGTNWQKGEIEVLQKATVRLPLFYFPGWKLWIDDRPASFNWENYYGLITFDLSAGNHKFLVSLTDTLVRQISNLISLLSILALVAFPILIKVRKWS